jgi:hypothetical protein
MLVSASATATGGNDAAANKFGSRKYYLYNDINILFWCWRFARKQRDHLCFQVLCD